MLATVLADIILPLVKSFWPNIKPTG